MSSFKDLKKMLQDNVPQNKPQEMLQDIPEGREITGYSIEECLEKAKHLFQVPENQLHYEIIEKGNKGILGVGKKLYRLYITIAQENEYYEESIEHTADSPFASIEKTSVKETGPIDGKVKMIIRKSGAYLKVTPPLRKGQPASFDDVLTMMATKNYRSYDGRLVKKITQEAKGEFIKIGEYTPNPDYDSKAEIQINDDETKAFLTITAPYLSGRILEESEIMDLLTNQGVTSGIKQEKIKEILEEEHYNVPILIAEGVPPQHGKDSEINFHFKTKPDDLHFEEDDFGKVNFFSDQGLIQNVVAGQILAVKNPPTKGTNGKTITGKVIEAEDGEDITFEAGKNTGLSENGLEIVAQNAGRAVFNDGVVEVEPIYEIKGNVGLKTGSIVFLGDVIVSENVEDGFSVKAAGNIYIGGTIGKAEVEADGDIIVQRGILGKEEGYVKAGGNVIAKFIENSKVTAGNKVVSNEGILHSYVDAKQVYSLGKRGTITGGHIRSVEEVNSKVIGSTTYTETKIEAGVDPVAKEKLVKFDKERETIEDNLSKLSVNLTTMQNQKRSMGSLSPERELMLERMLRAKKEYDMQLKEINLDIEEIKSYLSSLTAQGKISAFDKIYPGTEVTIKNIILKIKSDYTHVTLIIESGEIKPTPYQEPKDRKALPQAKGGKRGKK